MNPFDEKPTAARSRAQILATRFLLTLLLAVIPSTVLAQDEDPPILALQARMAIAPPPPLDGEQWVAFEADYSMLPAAAAMPEAEETNAAADDKAGGKSGDAAADDGAAAKSIGRVSDEAQTNWSGTFKQSLFFLGIMHGYRLLYEPDTRAALRGPFFKDYFRSVKHLRGWSDGDSFLTNYIGHPMMGATAGRILLHNNRYQRRLDPGLNREYLKSRMKAFGFATLFSLQFEIGLISEATIGNAMPNEHTRHPFSYIDIVVTPTAGTAWLVGEDLLEHHLIRRIERRTKNRVIRSLSRSFLNPTRGMANLLRLKWPWYRDDRLL